MKNHGYLRQKAKVLLCIEKKGKLCQHCRKDVFEVPWEAEFHHMGEKNEMISYLISKKHWSEVQEELDLCELLCVACHRKHHYNVERFNDNKEDILNKMEDIRQGKRVKKQISKEQIEESFRLYGEGKQISEIAKTMNYHYETIRRALIKNGLTSNTKRIKLESPEINEKFIGLWKSGLPVRLMKEEFNCGKDAIFSKAKQLIQQGLITPRR